jgi:Ca2+-transporting ATPase
MTDPAHQSCDPPGLTFQEAARLLAAEGPNELPSSRPRTLWAMAAAVAGEPMFLLLVACGVVYLFLGEPREALLLLGFVLLTMGITIYQERKTERALEALRDLASPRALVVRDGVQARIPGREVVRGDILVLSEGDRVPADAVLLSALNLTVDESLLTGESVAVRKLAREERPGEDYLGEEPPPGGDDQPFVYAGTLVVAGSGLARVTRVGAATRMGGIGRALAEIGPQQTALQRQTGRLVKRLALGGLALALAVAVIYGYTRSDWLGGVLAGLSLAMATLPEEFPVVLTVFLALGAWRMSSRQVLTRRLPAVETLGSATVLCVDKTGTLTQNRLSVRQLWAGGLLCRLNEGQQTSLPLHEGFHELIEYGILASQREPFDPLEQALTRAGGCLGDGDHLHGDWQLVREYPLSHQLLAISHVWRTAGDDHYVVAAKGAPEAVVDLCHLTDQHTVGLMGLVAAMADEGLRTIAVAAARIPAQAPSAPGLPEGQHGFPFEFVGLVGLADPVREGVPEAVAQCRRAGIRVLMITGDHPRTARAVARQAGLELADQVLTGPELAGLDDAALGERLKRVGVCARVAPEQKLRLVQALATAGEVVAMTGDGVNDAPALKAAHIGVAMGGRGADVAREAADLVLLDDDFSSIVAAVAMGRRIFDNLHKAMAYILAVHVPIAGLSLVPVLLGWPLVLLPVHIVFLELIIDPACSVAFQAEPPEPDLMDRPPRDPAEPLFGLGSIGLALAQGLSVLAITLAINGTALALERDPEEARALAFTTLVLANLGLILANRSWSELIVQTLARPNPAMWWIVAGAAVFLGLALYTPWLRGIFHFDLLHGHDLALCLAGASAGLFWFELLKLVKRRRGRRPDGRGGL